MEGWTKRLESGGEKRYKFKKESFRWFTRQIATHSQGRDHGGMGLARLVRLSPCASETFHLVIVSHRASLLAAHLAEGTDITSHAETRVNGTENKGRPTNGGGGGGESVCVCAEQMSVVNACEQHTKRMVLALMPGRSYCDCDLHAPFFGPNGHQVAK